MRARRHSPRGWPRCRAAVTELRFQPAFRAATRPVSAVVNGRGTAVSSSLRPKCSRSTGSRPFARGGVALVVTGAGARQPPRTLTTDGQQTDKGLRDRIRLVEASFSPSPTPETVQLLDVLTLRPSTQHLGL